MTDLTDDEALAAEYVLGTLSAAERAEAERRQDHDAAFAALIAIWEQRFAPLAQTAPALAPPSDLFARILSRLPPAAAATLRSAAANDNVLRMRRQIRTWRGVALMASTLAALMALWIAGREVRMLMPRDETYVAVLQRGPDQPSFVVSLDLANRRMAVMPLDAAAPPGKSYELWMIEGPTSAPLSMGVVDSKTALRPRLPNVNEAVLSHATYAVTVEPLGGSPTGKPTSAPLFTGKLTNMAL